MSERVEPNPGDNPNRTIADKAPKPAGIMPKNLQSMVMIGIAVLMVLIMWLTGGGKKAATATEPAVPAPPPVMPTDTAQVQDFEKRIQSEQQAAHHPVPGANASQTSLPSGSPGYDAYGAASMTGAQSPVAPPSPGAFPQYAGQEQQPIAPPPPNPIEVDRKRRAYESLFASNVALTYRRGEEGSKLLGSDRAALAGDGSASASYPNTQSVPMPGLAALASQDPQLEWLNPTQLPALGSPQPANQPRTPASTPGNAAGKDDKPRSAAKAPNPYAATPGAFNSASGPAYVLFEGTTIDTALMNRLDGSFSGPVDCLVTNDVYSHDHQHVLIPAGAKIVGEAQKVNTFGQRRLAVFFHRLIMPDGLSVSLDQFKGLDQVGATALHDKVNNHYAKIFGASMAVGILGGIAEIGTGDILTQSAIDRARVGFGEGMATAGEQILDRFLNILPTITIREGTRVKVYLSNDLLLPDYAHHTMPSDL